MNEVGQSGFTRGDRAGSGGSTLRRIGLGTFLAAISCAVFPAVSQAAAPEIVNTSAVGGQASWLETFSTGGETNNSANKLRITALIEHEPEDSVTAFRVDDNYDGTDDTTGAGTNKTFAAQRPTITGGLNYTTVTFDGANAVGNNGLSGSVRRSDRTLRIRAVMSDGQFVTASTTLKLQAVTQSTGDQDFPYIFQRSQNATAVTPGSVVNFTYRGDDPDSCTNPFGCSDTAIGGVRYRARRMSNGTLTGVTEVCSGNSDNTTRNFNVTFPNRGRWVVEAEALNDNDGSGCTASNTATGNWQYIGTVDVNSTAAPSISLSATRPNTNGNTTITANLGTDADNAQGGRPQYVEWDLDDNGSFETTSLGDAITGITAPTKSINTTGKAPGVYEVNARVVDNGALGGSDNIRRTSSTVTTTYTVNSPPVLSAPGSVTTEKNTSVAINLSATDANGDTRTYSVTSGPSNGSGSFTSTTGASTTYNYTPNSGFVGSDSITFQVSDGFGGTDTETVNINVVDTTPPQTTIDSGPANGSTTNDDSVTFTFSSNESGSTFECQVDGAGFTSCTSPVTYSNLGPGTHTFEVRATDPSGNTDPTPASRTFTLTDAGMATSDGTTANFQAEPGDANSVTVTGGGGLPYVITDTGGGNVEAGPGCTQVSANVVTCPDSANIVVNLGDGNDSFNGSTAAGGNFTINGGPGNDNLTGSNGNDTINGGSTDAGMDRMDGGPGSDSISGGSGIDRALYTNSVTAMTVTIDGNANDADGTGATSENVGTDVESITGGNGDDSIEGSCLNNTLAGQGGNDTINGDPNVCGVYGVDFMGGGTGNDEMNGLGGSDSVTYTTNTAVQPISATLNNTADDNDGTGGTDDIADDVENVYGGAGADTIDASAAGQGVALFGRAGDDTLTGSPFNDFLRGELGADTLDCAGGANDMFTPDGADTSVTNCETPG